MVPARGVELSDEEAVLASVPLPVQVAVGVAGTEDVHGGVDRQARSGVGDDTPACYVLSRYSEKSSLETRRMSSPEESSLETKR